MKLKTGDPLILDDSALCLGNRQGRKDIRVKSILSILRHHNLDFTDFKDFWTVTIMCFLYFLYPCFKACSKCFDLLVECNM